jgi:hypothetical protein
MTFVTWLSDKIYLRHALIGHLNLCANLLLLGVLSFHRIVLHQLGLWDDCEHSVDDVQAYRIDLKPSTIELLRNRIIQDIYSMFIHDEPTTRRKHVTTKNQLRSFHVPSIASIVHREMLSNQQFQATVSDNHDQVSSVKMNFFDRMKNILEVVRKFYSFAIGNSMIIMNKNEQHSSFIIRIK